MRKLVEWTFVSLDGVIDSPEWARPYLDDDHHRYARALLCYQEGKATESIEDLKIVLQHEPDNVRALDLLGQSLLLLEQPQEADPWQPGHATVP